jgi:hypothetical protein
MVILPRVDFRSRLSFASDVQCKEPEESAVRRLLESLDRTSATEAMAMQKKMREDMLSLFDDVSHVRADRERPLLPGLSVAAGIKDQK